MIQLLITSTFFIRFLEAYSLQRIVGGMKVDISEIPYQTSLQYSGRHYCGGTIISPRYIITAGHCMYDL